MIAAPLFRSMRLRVLPVWLVLLTLTLLPRSLYPRGLVDGVSAQASGFLISGTVVSSRDGSPVPFAQLQAVPSPTGVHLSQRMLTQPDARGRFGAGPGGARGARANRAASPPADEASATADGSGHFRMEVPHAGRWTLSATAHGFATQTFDTHEGYFASIVLNESVPTYSVTFHLTPGAAFSGTVLDEAGEAVEHAQVTAELLPARSGDRAQDTQVRTFFAATDDRGRYEITRLEPGRYRIKVIATPWYAQGARGQANVRFTGTVLQLPAEAQAASPDPSLDLVYAPTWFPGTTDQAAAEPLTLHAGEERQADIQLLATPAVHLEVPLAAAQTESDERQQNSNVIITRVASTGFDFATQVTPGSGGIGRSGSLTPGLYQVRRTGFDQGAGNDEEVREIEIPAGASGTITLDSARPLIRVAIAYEGQAAGSDDPGQLNLVDTASGRRISAGESTAFRRIRRGGGNTAGPAAGSVTAPDRSIFVPPGRYAVYLEGSDQTYLTGLSAVGATVEGRYVTIGDGKPKLTVRVASGRAELGGIAQTAGPARLAGGKDLPATAPVEGAMVVLVPVTLGQKGDLAIPYRDETNTDGSFDLTGVIPGRYILIALDHGWDIDFHDPTVLAKYLMQGVPIELAAGNHAERRIEAQAP